MNHRELAVVQGWPETRATLAAWNRAPFGVFARWVGLSALIACALLACIAAVAAVTPPDEIRIDLAGVYGPAGIPEVLTIFGRNSVVLALHSMACLAGFIAMSSLPREAEAYRGWWRWVHDKAGPAAVVFVTGATLFSLATQAYALGGRLSTLTWQMDADAGWLLLALTPHALPELVAIFLPLAAWLVAARVHAWHQLLAATLVTTTIALPVLLAAAAVEVYVTPEVLRALHFV